MFKNQLKQWLADHGETRQQFSIRAKLNFHTVCKIVDGKYKSIEFETAWKIYLATNKELMPWDYIEEMAELKTLKIKKIKR